MTPLTMLQKIWNAHLVHSEPDGLDVLYVDLHLLHEVTSAQAFSGLREAGRTVRRPDLCLATVDHNVPTTDRTLPIIDNDARAQVQALRHNVEAFKIPFHDVLDPNQGIVHVIGPELGYTQPGMTIVCGDSHTSTHGAFGALAFGIGTSEVEHVLATQCVLRVRPRSMKVNVEGALTDGVTAKDLILGIIGQIGIGGGRGHVIEYGGSAIRRLSMEARMTVCNMSIEAGARAGMIAPDDTAFEYLRGRAMVPEGDAFDAEIARWRAFASDRGATYDTTVNVDVSSLEPQVTWGTHPGMVAPISGTIPYPDSLSVPEDREAAARALEYMDLTPGTSIQDLSVDRVFLGSCTNGRIEDLRAAAAVVRGKKVSPGVQALVVPGSTPVKNQAEAEGLDRIFLDAGFDWRESGCSMCLAMNDDVVPPGERCASTSNRNFEGRQGAGARTHLVSPAMAAAAAVAGHFVDIREWV